MNCDKNECSAVVLRAGEFFLQGYNCAQAVFAAFAPLVGAEEKEALRLASPFGGGFGRMREVCGAFSGMMLVVGRVFGYDSADPSDDSFIQKVELLLDADEKNRSQC